LAASNEHLRVVEFVKTYQGTYRISVTHGNKRPLELLITAHVTSQREPTRKHHDFGKNNVRVISSYDL